MLQEIDFRFDAIEERDGQDYPAPLQFCAADEKSEKYLQKVWHRLSQAVISHHDFSGTPETCPSWSKWKPHEWCKQNIQNRQQFVAWNGPVLAGFLNIRDGFASQHRQDVSLIYVEHVAAFPGFISSEIWRRKLKFVGVPMLAFAVFQSFSQGYDGALGLHVDGGAIKFYRELPEIMGFPVFYEGKYDVPGPAPAGEDARSQVYLEMMPEAATKILEGHRNV